MMPLLYLLINSMYYLLIIYHSSKLRCVSLGNQAGSLGTTNLVRLSASSSNSRLLPRITQKHHTYQKTIMLLLSSSITRKLPFFLIPTTPLLIITSRRWVEPLWPQHWTVAAPPHPSPSPKSLPPCMKGWSIFLHNQRIDACNVLWE